MYTYALTNQLRTKRLYKFKLIAKIPKKLQPIYSNVLLSIWGLRPQSPTRGPAQERGLCESGDHFAPYWQDTVKADLTEEQ